MSRSGLRAPRVSWALLLMLAAVAAVGLAAVDAMRTEHSHRGTAERALRDYASFAAWGFQERLRGALAASVRETLGAVNHGDAVHEGSRIPDASELPHYLRWDPACYCHVARSGPLPMRYFGFRLGADTLGVALNTASHPERGWLLEGAVPEHADARRYDARERQWVNDTLTALTRLRGRSDWGFRIVVGTLHGRTRWLAYTLMPTSAGDTIVYGVEYAAHDVEAMLGRVLRSEGVLPPTFAGGRAADEMLSLEMRAADDGPVLFAAGPRTRWGLDVRHALPASYGGMVVRAQVRPELADELVIGGLPRSRMPYLIGLLMLAAGLAIVAAVQLRREQQIARMRTNFVASVSHELRTPLAQMRLSLETLRLGRFRTEAQRIAALDLVSREVRRLAHLVENVLRFGGAPASADAAGEVIDAAAEAREVAIEFAPLAAARRATVEVSAEGVVPVRVREGALRQVLLNLLDNAVKYGPAEQVVQLRVSCAGEVARLEVRDRGPGVPAAERDAVWRPFQRGSGAMRVGVGGSGIGLTVVRDLVAAHGGRSWVDDAPGGGALVIVELPLASGDSAAPEGPAVHAVGERPA